MNVEDPYDQGLHLSISTAVNFWRQRSGAGIRKAEEWCRYQELPCMREPHCCLV